MKFNKDGLIPAIIQDDKTGSVLMLGYMNQEAYDKTIETKQVWFYSRSRQKLWHKGETSGNFLDVKTITLDCDKDALLVTANPQGNTCHTGEYSCFHNNVLGDNQLFRELTKLEEIIQGRKANLPDQSYTTSLFNSGLDRIAQKVGEEAVEVIIASKGERVQLVDEISDLVYHLLVLMREKDIDLSEIYYNLYIRSC
jgi:phosphoribosyl-ATP pyrophosphohydrolase/phosphoribosyl-AMP cyclohydrolase